MTITFLLFPADNLDSVKVQFYISGSILDIYITLIFRKYSKNILIWIDYLDKTWSFQLNFFQLHHSTLSEILCKWKQDAFVCSIMSKFCFELAIDFLLITLL